jgi:hypothetical protein
LKLFLVILIFIGILKVLLGLMIVFFRTESSFLALLSVDGPRPVGLEVFIGDLAGDFPEGDFSVYPVPVNARKAFVSSSESESSNCCLLGLEGIF